MSLACPSDFGPKADQQLNPNTQHPHTQREQAMNIVITNLSGNVGKTTMRKHLFGPLLAGSRQVSVEDMNDGDGPVSVELSAREFRQLAVELNTTEDDHHAVIDIGSSNLREALEHFRALRSTRELIDLWAIPCVPTIKQRNDTVSTIKLLADMGVPTSRIVVIPSQVADVRDVEATLKPLMDSASEIGYRVCPTPVMFNDVFQMLKDRSANVFDIASNATDFRAEARRHRHDPGALEDIGRAMVARDLAADACKNLQAVFAQLELH